VTVSFDAVREEVLALLHDVVSNPDVGADLDLPGFSDLEDQLGGTFVMSVMSVMQCRNRRSESERGNQNHQAKFSSTHHGPSLS